MKTLEQLKAEKVELDAWLPVSGMLSRVGIRGVRDQVKIRASITPEQRAKITAWYEQVRGIEDAVLAYLDEQKIG